MRQSKNPVAILSLLCLCVFVPALVPLAAQDPKAGSAASTQKARLDALQKRPLAELITELRTNQDPLVIEALRQRGDKGAIPPLKELFQVVQDKPKKRQIALTLIRLGETESYAIDYLTNLARAVLDSEMPFPWDIDNQRKVIPKKFTEEFVAWCKDRGLEPNDAAFSAIYGEQQQDFMLLAKVGDARTVDILLRGLQAKHFITVAAAAEGLARMQYKGAIRPIIQACERAPSDFVSQIARALVAFDSAEAQAAAEHFIQNKEVLQFLRQRVKEKGPAGMFGDI